MTKFDPSFWISDNTKIAINIHCIQNFVQYTTKHLCDQADKQYLQKKRKINLPLILDDLQPSTPWSRVCKGPYFRSNHFFLVRTHFDYEGS